MSRKLLKRLASRVAGPADVVADTNAWLDPHADQDTILLARRTLGGRRSGFVRREFLEKNAPMLARFFSDLWAEEVDRLAE